MVHYHGERPGEIVVSVGVHVGHLGRLAPDERASGIAAAGGDTVDHRFDDGRVQVAEGQVIQEEEWASALDEDVVDAMGYKIDADRVVPVREKRDLEFGADAVAAAGKVNVAKLFWERKESRESSDPGRSLRRNDPLDPPDEPASRLDGDS